MTRLPSTSRTERIAPVLLTLLLTGICGLPLALLLSHGLDGVHEALGQRRVLRALSQSLYSAAGAAMLASVIGTLLALTLRLGRHSPARSADVSAAAADDDTPARHGHCLDAGARFRAAAS